MHNIKPTIDGILYDKSVKMGEMQRENTIRMNQLCLKLQGLDTALMDKKQEVRNVENGVLRMQEVINKRKRLTLQSENSVQKVQNLYNSLKY